MPAFPRPHERGISRHRVGTDPKVVLGVALEDVAVEKRQLVERRQPLAGDILAIDRVCALEPAVLPPGDVVAPRQIVVANGGHDRRLGDRSIEPERRAAAKLDVVDEGDREPAVDCGPDVFVERIAQPERHEKAAVARERRDLHVLLGADDAAEHGRMHTSATTQGDSVRVHHSFVFNRSFSSDMNSPMSRKWR